jgi:hypothetical protein
MFVAVSPSCFFPSRFPTKLCKHLLSPPFPCPLINLLTLTDHTKQLIADLPCLNRNRPLFWSVLEWQFQILSKVAIQWFDSSEQKLIQTPKTFRRAQREHEHFFITDINLLTLSKEIIDIHSEIRTSKCSKQVEPLGFEWLNCYRCQVYSCLFLSNNTPIVCASGWPVAPGSTVQTMRPKVHNHTSISCWVLQHSGIYRNAVSLKYTDVSEVRTASIIRTCAQLGIC